MNDNESSLASARLAGQPGVTHWLTACGFTGSYGTAFKAPTFNELYFPGFGNADLRAEESRSFELGLSGSVKLGALGRSTPMKPASTI